MKTKTYTRGDILTGRNGTINLSLQHEVEREEKMIKLGYIKPLSYKDKLFMKYTKLILSLATIGIIFIILLATGMKYSISHADSNEHDTFINKFPLSKTIIGCYNDRTKETREESKCTQPGDHNIKLPPQAHIVHWLKFYSEHQTLNRLAIPNFESDFEEMAENQQAKGYLQTLKSHKVGPDIMSQIKWLKNREDKTYGRLSYPGKYGEVKGCAIYWDNYNYKDGFNQGEYGVLSCMYRFHYDTNKGSWYAQRGIKTTKFYKKYLYNMD